MGVVLPSKVISLVIRKPPHFSFKPGDYIYINIPNIAFFEWHPFTISSAPEEADFFSLHIRAVGHWTNQLYQYFTQEQERLESTKKGEQVAAPETKFEAFQTTVERVRKTSRMMMATDNAQALRKASTMQSTHENR